MEKRLILGTVQLGMKYGLADHMPNESQVDAILDRAWSIGIRRFDCAQSYGEAEDRLGNWLMRNRAQHDAIIDTKLAALPVKGTSLDIVNAMETAIAGSIRRLRVDRLGAYLTHNALDLSYDGIAEKFSSFASDGLIRAFGASCYDPAEAIELHRSFAEATAFQLPASFLDRRYEGYASEMAQEGPVSITLRSVMLQGVAALTPEMLPDHLSGLATPVAHMREAAQSIGLSPAAFCLNYVLSRHREARVTFGVVDAFQLSMVEEVLSHGLLDNGTIRDLDLLIGEIPHRLIDPRLWLK